MKKTIIFTSLLLLAAFAFVAGISRSRGGPAAPTANPGRKVLYYVDPMNPAHTSPRPGLAPCGMEMEPVYADSPARDQQPIDTPPLSPAGIKVSPEKQQLIGVRSAVVERKSGTRTLRAFGTVALDETRVSRVAASIDGWVRSVAPVVTGNLVKKDDVLANFYNRDFLTAQQTYLYALNTMDRFKDDESAEQLKVTRAQLRAAEENLEFLGMGETQRKEIARTRELAASVELRSPSAGLVVVRNAFTGLRFERGAELFRIAALDRVWILADVFENEAEFFGPGTTAVVTLRTQKQTLQARVTDTLPRFDPVTRTLKVRLEAENPDLLLRPDMFVDVDLALAYPETITVPADAVLDSGLRRTVFVERGNGFFEPRAVETGWRAEDRIQILKGLAPGERIVISGNFLLDSESRMKLAASSFPSAPTTDPVCRMSVDPSSAAAGQCCSEYQGKTYSFCSPVCKRRFDEAPEKYLAAAGAN